MPAFFFKVLKLLSHVRVLVYYNLEISELEENNFGV